MSTFCDSQLSPSPMAGPCPEQALIMLHSVAGVFSHCLLKSKLYLMNRRVLSEGSMYIQSCLSLLKIEPLSGILFPSAPAPGIQRSSSSDLMASSLVTQHPSHAPASNTPDPSYLKDFAHVVFQPVKPSSPFPPAFPRSSASPRSGFFIFNMRTYHLGILLN